MPESPTLPVRITYQQINIKALHFSIEPISFFFAPIRRQHFGRKTFVKEPLVPFLFFFFIVVRNNFTLGLVSFFSLPFWRQFKQLELSNWTCYQTQTQFLVGLYKFLSSPILSIPVFYSYFLKNVSSFRENYLSNRPLTTKYIIHICDACWES